MICLVTVKKIGFRKFKMSKNMFYRPINYIGSLELFIKLF